MITFGQLAKRISAWTSRALVSAIILVAGLAFGRQVLQWWRPANESPRAEATDPLGGRGLGDAAQDHFVEFGGSDWGMVRGTARGDVAAVIRLLESRCAEMIPLCPLPSGPPGPAERDLLHRIAAQSPRREQPGQWRLFVLDAAFPMVVGTRWSNERASSPRLGGSTSSATAEAKGSSGEGASPARLAGPTAFRPIAGTGSSTKTEDPAGEEVAKPVERVITFGMATPTDADQWTIWSFHTVRQSHDGIAPQIGIPIPPEGKVVLSIRSLGGGVVAAFRGWDSGSHWPGFFDSWLRSHGWESTKGWVDRGTSRTLRAVRDRGGALGDQCEGGTIDVLLTTELAGETTGLVVWTPVSDEVP